VKPGETGLSIARAYGVPWSRITTANRVAPDAPLEVGQALLIPSARTRAAARPATPSSAQPASTYASATS
jgi:LysM repeat protein